MWVLFEEAVETLGGSSEVGEVGHWELVLENIVSLVTSGFIFCFLVGHEVNSPSLPHVYSILF